MIAFCAVIVDKTPENVNGVEMTEYEDDFELEESEKSSVANSDDGEYTTSLRKINVVVYFCIDIVLS